MTDVVRMFITRLLVAEVGRLRAQNAELKEARRNLEARLNLELRRAARVSTADLDMRDMALNRGQKGPCPYWPGCGCGTQSGPHTCEWQQKKDRPGP